MEITWRGDAALCTLGTSYPVRHAARRIPPEQEPGRVYVVMRATCSGIQVTTLARSPVGCEFWRFGKKPICANRAEGCFPGRFFLFPRIATTTIP
jgi:hypothetical protein